MPRARSDAAQKKRDIEPRSCQPKKKSFNATEAEEVAIFSDEKTGGKLEGRDLSDHLDFTSNRASVSK